MTKPKIRQLTSDEKKLCENGIKRLEKYKNKISPRIKYYDYQILHGLKSAYETQLQEQLSKKEEINQEIFNTDLKIIELRRQIEKGVEVKQKGNIKTICPTCGQEEK